MLVHIFIYHYCEMHCIKRLGKGCLLLTISKVEAERRASKEEENRASEEYIQKLLAEDEEEEKRQAERRRSEVEEQLRSDEELARRLSSGTVSVGVAGAPTWEAITILHVFEHILALLKTKKIEFQMLLYETFSVLCICCI